MKLEVVNGPLRGRRRSERELPSEAEVTAKRQIYAAAEPRDLAYKVARHLIEQAYKAESDFSLGDGVGILLMSWNAGFFRFRPDRQRTLAADLDRLIASHRTELDEFRIRSVASYDDDAEGAVVAAIYGDFLTILWPVGTAKALHVLAPSFFPIWDRAIAQEFRLRLSPPANSVASYLDLMRIARRFAANSRFVDPLKALDEWAYVSFTLRQ